MSGAGLRGLLQSVASTAGKALQVQEGSPLAGAMGRAGVNMVLNGSVFDALLQKSRVGATLKGTDEYGNMYYERIEGTQHGRHRWVVYKDIADSGQIAGAPTSVPPEWHGWLHHITDDEPTGAPAAFEKPSYAVDAYVTRTGTLEKYQPKGAFLNPQYRYSSWKKYQAWKPQ